MAHSRHCSFLINKIIMVITLCFRGAFRILQGCILVPYGQMMFPVYAFGFNASGVKHVNANIRMAQFRHCAVLRLTREIH